MPAATAGNVMNDSSAHSKSCPKCGAELPVDATEGLCPRCLMAEAMQPTAPRPAGGAWQPPSPEELQALMPGYTIERLLGKGGMGAVYKGVQENLDRPVAIKIISNVLDETDASYGERFKNEARAMAKLNHPGIVAVHDYGETANGILYIVMEYIEGTDVARMIAQQGRLHTEHAMAISAHVCDALAYAHERGIIHRDIKPANIMVSKDGVVKVADFGLAKMTQSGESGLTQSGMAMGTLHYMAPEALMLGTSVDHRADIYAVGVMLYQMLTGKVPHGMFELPSMQVPGLDPRYDAIIAQAMREDRDIRYQSVRELRGSLDHILTQPVVQVDPQATRASAAVPAQAGRPTTQVHRTAGQPYRPPQQTQVVLRQQQKSSPQVWVAVVVVLGLAGTFFVNRSKPTVEPKSAMDAQAVKEEPKDGGVPTGTKAVTPEPSATKAATVVPARVESPPPKTVPSLVASVPLRASPDTPELRRGLVSWWKADNDARDAVGSNHGSLVGAASFTDGLYGKAFQLDGGYVEVPDSPSLQFGPDSKFTVTLWAYRTNENRPFHFFGKRSDQRGDTGGTKGYQLGFAGSVPQFAFNEWAFWAVVYDGSRQSVYINGGPLSTYGKISSGGPVPFRIGRSGDWETFKGKVDDVRVYDRAMTPREIKALHEWREPKPEPAKLEISTIPELAALQQQLIKLQAERVTAVFEGDVAKLNSGYLGGLDREMVKERGAGRLDGVLALEAEKKLITAKQPVPATDDEGVNAAVKNLRTIYRDAYAKLETARMTNYKALTGPLALRLKTLESDLTKQNRIADAKAVREYREKLPAQESAVAYSAANPFTNSLGMKFVPVPGTDILFCTHITRRQDYAAYAAEVPNVDTAWKTHPKDSKGGPVAQGDDYPVVGVSWNDAMAFCDWLSTQEGRHYRLPTDREWSYAVGIGPQEEGRKNATPESLSEKIRNVFPWGTTWPPPKGAGNFADVSLQAASPKPDANCFRDYDDGYPSTSPVLAFKPNKLGIHDLAGNIGQWCGDWYNSAQTHRVQRGGDYLKGLENRNWMLSSFRAAQKPENRLYSDIGFSGFRCVLVSSSIGNEKNEAAKAAPAAPATVGSAPAAVAVSPDGYTNTLGMAFKNVTFANTLGMKFVPMPGSKALICIHETRKGDYAAFAAENPAADASWRTVRNQYGTLISNGNDHPVVNVTWEEAMAFCAWLSKKEGKVYRLPTDREWSIAAGLGSKESTLGTPQSRHDKIKDAYSWGSTWPPPAGAGNFADATMGAQSPDLKVLKTYNDGYATTSPVMSFAPNALGIYDLSGNAWELIDDWYNASKKDHLMRGGAFDFGDREWLNLSARDPWGATNRLNTVGFRCVVELPATTTPPSGAAVPKP